MKLFIIKKFSNYLLVPLALSDIIKGEKVYYYPGLKEEIYLCDFLPDKNFWADVSNNIDVKSKVIVTIRPPAIYANYHDDLSEKLYEKLLEYLSFKKNCLIIFLPRVKEQVDSTLQLLQRYNFDKNSFLIPSKPLDGPNLVYFSDLVISGGGTMVRRSCCSRNPRI